MKGDKKMDAATVAKLDELQQSREELAHQQDIARANALRETIVVNTRAIPHLHGIPKGHAEKRVADAKKDLATLDMLISLR